MVNTPYLTRHIATRDKMPPHKPIICFLLSFSLKITIEASELKMIALPFIRGKKSWLGRSPERRRFKKFIRKVHTPQTREKTKSFLENPSDLKLALLERIRLYTREHIKAMKRKLPVSPLCEEL